MHNDVGGGFQKKGLHDSSLALKARLRKGIQVQLKGFSWTTEKAFGISSFGGEIVKSGKLFFFNFGEVISGRAFSSSSFSQVLRAPQES